MEHMEKLDSKKRKIGMDSSLSTFDYMVTLFNNGSAAAKVLGRRGKWGLSRAKIVLCIMV